MIWGKIGSSDTNVQFAKGYGAARGVPPCEQRRARWEFSATTRESVGDSGAPYLAAGSAGYPFATLALDAAGVIQIHRELVGSVGYKSGAKCAAGDRPENIDGAGYVGWLLCEATPAPLRPLIARDLIGRSSGQLTQWLRRCGFKRSSVDGGRLSDNALRVAITPAARNPLTARLGFGHIVLIRNGRTIESHSGRGVNSREWTGTGWQARCAVYVLTR